MHARPGAVCKCLKEARLEGRVRRAMARRLCGRERAVPETDSGVDQGPSQKRGPGATAWSEGLTGGLE